MSDINQNWDAAGECLPKEPCESFNELQFPNRQKDKDGKIVPLDAREAKIYSMCCDSGNAKCEPSLYTVIEVYVTIYNSVLSDPLRGLMPNVDYCPDEEGKDSLCPPKANRSGQLELVIVPNKKYDGFEEKPDNPSYRDIPTIGCGGKDITPKKSNQYTPTLDPGTINYDPSVPGFPIIIPIEYSVAGIPVIKPVNPENGVNQIPINKCPVGPYRVLSKRFLTGRYCVPRQLGKLNECASIGLPAQTAVMCYQRNVTDFCNMEQCLQFEDNSGVDVENDAGDKGFRIDVQAFLRQAGKDVGWDCVGYNDKPYVIITKSTGDTILNKGKKNETSIIADIIRIDVKIGQDCEQAGNVPDRNRLRKRSLYKRTNITCANRNSGCTQILLWDNKDTPPTTPAGYELVKTYTCADADSTYLAKSQINIDKEKIEEECSGAIDINGYCCVTNTVTGQKTIETTTFNSCCISDSIDGLSASWLGAINDIEEGAAIAMCDPCVMCCVGSENNNALCVYTFQDKISGKWTYAKEIVSGDTTAIRQAACDAFTASGIGEKIFVDKVAQESEISIVDKANVSYDVYLILEELDKTSFYKPIRYNPPFKAIVVSTDPFTGEKTRTEKEVSWEVLLQSILESKWPKKLGRKPDKDGNPLPNIVPIYGDSNASADILFSSTNGTLEIITEIKTDEMTNYTCTRLCPSTTSSKGYRSGATKCSDLNGRVVLTQNETNYDQFWSDDPCLTLNIDCENLPEPPENKPNPSDNPELPQPLPKEETPDEPKTPPVGPDPKRPPDKQPRRCVDSSFTYKGKTHKVAISFPLNIKDELFGEQLDLTFNNIDELFAYIKQKADNLETFPDKLLALMGINKSDTNNGVLNPPSAASWQASAEYNCGDKPAPDAPPVTPDPEGPVDEDDPPEATACACVSLNNSPTRKVNLPIIFRENGVDYNLDSPQKLNEYLNKYASLPFSNDGKINVSFLNSKVVIALELQNRPSLRFTYRMVPCDCNQDVPDNPNAPNPRQDRPSPPPKSNPQQPPENINCNNLRSDLKKKQKYLSDLEVAMTEQKNLIAENLSVLDSLIIRWNSDCANAWWPSFKCDNLAKKICEAWDGTGSIPKTETNTPNNFPSKIAGKKIKPGKKPLYNKQQLEKTIELIEKTQKEIETLEASIIANCT